MKGKRILLVSLLLNAVLAGVGLHASAQARTREEIAKRRQSETENAARAAAAKRAAEATRPEPRTTKIASELNGLTDDEFGHGRRREPIRWQALQISS